MAKARRLLRPAFLSGKDVKKVPQSEKKFSVLVMDGLLDDGYAPLPRRSRNSSPFENLRIFVAFGNPVITPPDFWNTSCGIPLAKVLSVRGSTE